MGVSRFEYLRVWQAAKQQCDRVGVLLNQPEFQRDRELSGQMNDAAISVLFNITEGFLRRRDKETLQFLRYAFASNGELKAGYYVAEGRHYLARDRGRGTRDGPRTLDGPRTKDQVLRTRLRPSSAGCSTARAMCRNACRS